MRAGAPDAPPPEDPGQQHAGLAPFLGVRAFLSAATSATLAEHLELLPRTRLAALSTHAFLTLPQFRQASCFTGRETEARKVVEMRPNLAGWSDRYPVLAHGGCPVT